jgi:soluble P-type ATPase
MKKPSIRIDIPGFGKVQINSILSDYTGTLAFNGKLVPGVKDRLLRLADLVRIHVVTADSFGTAEEELKGLPIFWKRLKGEKEDAQKAHCAVELNPRYVASFGNGNNDRLHLKVVKEAGGLAIAVENGEGCALDAILNANLFVVGAVNALDLLLEPTKPRELTRLVGTLRF